MRLIDVDSTCQDQKSDLPEGVFLATSDDVPGMTVECEIRDEIIATAPEIALDLLEVEAGYPLPRRPVVTFAFN